GRGVVESAGRRVKNQENRAARERQQQRELRPHAARKRLDLPARRQVEGAQVALLELDPPARIEGFRVADDLVHGHPVVEILVLADEAGAAAKFEAWLPSI